MRQPFIASWIVLTLAFATAEAAEPAAPVIRRSPPANPAVAVLTYYPAAAKAAGVSGSATISCAPDTQVELHDCVLVSETPAGQGFGDAALRLAANSVGLFPGVTLAKAPPRGTMTVTFTANPESITPNLLFYTSLINTPRMQWTRVPTAAEVYAAYPPAARRARIGGLAKLDCMVTIDGRLTDCRIADEEPSGQGFGTAALTLVPDLQAAPEPPPFAGRRFRVVVPIRFQPA